MSYIANLNHSLKLQRKNQILIKRLKISDWIDSRQAEGLYYFTLQEASNTLGLTRQALARSLTRLVNNGRIVSIYHGFYLILPVEYKSWGVLPPDWFINDLMAYLEQPYYAGLLTAADYYGASHQKPMAFHVITSKPIRDIQCKRIKIRFFAKKDIDFSLVEQKNSQTGYIRVSCPELTVIDLLKYQNRAAGLNHIFSVLKELAENLDSERLVEAAESEGCTAYAQRLGWLLKQTDHPEKHQKLACWIKRKQPGYVKLDPKLPMKNSSRNCEWKLLINTQIEEDFA